MAFIATFTLLALEFLEAHQDDIGTDIITTDTLAHCITRPSPMLYLTILV